MINIATGSTNVSLLIEAVGGDDHATPGTPQTGLDHDDVASIGWAIVGSAADDATPVTLANAAAAHSDGGFVEVDAALMPGIYRVDLPDSIFAAAAHQVGVCVRFDAGLKLRDALIALAVVDPQPLEDVRDRFLGRHVQNLATGVHKFYREDGVTVLMQRVVTETTDDGDPAVAWDAP